ncbi:MFS transporter [Deinococcus rubellus]|uniref:MFS transporter n=1 Tax=Deinococcus rubellus TaxID=1889240 RepID=UPI0035E3F69B
MAPAAPAPFNPAQRWTLIATVLGSSMAFIDGSVVNVALNALQKDFGADLTAAQWVVNAYTLMLAALILTGGALGDVYGRKRLFGLGVLIFAAASLGCGLAPNLPLLIAARILQGIGGALLIPGSLALINTVFPGSSRGRAIGLWSSTTSLVTIFGPALGGVLVDTASWRVVFLIGAGAAESAGGARHRARLPLPRPARFARLGAGGAGSGWADLRPDQRRRKWTHRPAAADCPGRRGSTGAVCPLGSPRQGTDAAAQSLSLRRLFWHQPADISALRRARRGAVFFAAQPDRGAGLQRRPRGDDLPATLAAAGRAVRLFWQSGRPDRPPLAAHGGPGAGGPRLRSARRPRRGRQLLDQGAAVQAGHRPGHGGHGGPADLGGHGIGRRRVFRHRFRRQQCRVARRRTDRAGGLHLSHAQPLPGGAGHLPASCRPARIGPPEHDQAERPPCPGAGSHESQHRADGCRRAGGQAGFRRQLPAGVLGIGPAGRGGRRGGVLELEKGRRERHLRATRTTPAARLLPAPPAVLSETP